MDDTFSATGIINLMLKWKKQLAIVAVATAVLSYGCSQLIKNKYKSEAVLYPSNLTIYGSETQTEQLLQLLESGEIRDGVIKKLNLINHYEIDTSKKAWKSSLEGMYDKNVNVEKTQYESVRLEVSDINADTACAIVNEIVNQLNEKTRALQRAKTEEIFVIIKRQYDLKKAEMDSMEKAIKELRVKYGVLDFATQAKESSKRYMKMISTPGGTSGPGFKEVDNIMRNLEEKGGEYVALTEHLWRTRGQYNDLKQGYENAIKDMKKELTYTNMVTRPVPADKKSYPLRWLIVLISTGSVLFFCLLAIAFIERKNIFKQPAL